MSAALNLRGSRHRLRRAGLRETATALENRHAALGLSQMLAPEVRSELARSLQTFRNDMPILGASLRSALDNWRPAGTHAFLALRRIAAEVGRVDFSGSSDSLECRQRDPAKCDECRYRQGGDSSGAMPRRPRAVADYPATPIRDVPIRHTCPNPSSQAPCSGCPRIGCVRTRFRFRA